MKTVFFDVDTQLDFLFPAGALYVPGAELIAPALAALTRFAREHSIPIVSTLDTHREDDPEFRQWKPHCVRGTQGWQKYAPTLGGQTLFEKNRIDFFEDEKLARLLDAFEAKRFVVYGLVTEYCVRSAIFGLLKRGARVELVTDAIKSLDRTKEREVLAKFAAAGGKLVETSNLLTA
ncbi:MAG TPA: cysteine hydrolase [Bryobacteraceae bacterium]|jgi:nicotinamidase/pyrazinamidase|nr:cysteine hydrolase [Bryobacteraceae bacterium]